MVVPDVGTAVMVYIETVCEGGLKDISAVVLVIFCAINPVGASGTFSVREVMTPATEVPSLLVAVNEYVYTVLGVCSVNV